MAELFYKISPDLPLFLIPDGEEMIIYTPGSFLKAKTLPVKKLNELVSHQQLIGNDEFGRGLKVIIHSSEEVKRSWNDFIGAPFTPECLTIHSGNECNMNCSYCYSNKTNSKKISGFPSLPAVDAAFNILADNIKNKSSQTTIVYHGSGEPTYHWEELVRTFNHLKSVAEKRNITLFSYIATNGCITEEQAYWLVRNMSLIGISCDGPPGVQEQQRGKTSDKYMDIKDLCSLISECGGRFDIRTTVTRQNFNELPKIIKYLLTELKAKVIRVEPVFLKDDFKLTEDDAHLFFRRYTEACLMAESSGASLTYSGARPEEFHETYCDVFRNTIRLTPDNLARNCFYQMGEEPGIITGIYKNENNKFLLSPELQNIKAKASDIPTVCKDCINIYHCSRGCPDFCIYRAEEGKTIPDLFRCRLNKLITVSKILSASK